VSKRPFVTAILLAILLGLATPASAVQLFEEPGRLVRMPYRPVAVRMSPLPGEENRLVVLDAARRVSFFDLDSDDPWTPIQVVEADGDVERELNYSEGYVDFADVNDDGIPDLIVDSGPVFILPGRPDGGFDAPYAWSISTSNLRVVDFDGDGRLDLVSTGYGSYLFTVRYGLGDGRFGPLTPIHPLPELQVVVASIDFDSDGDLDGLALQYREREMYRTEPDSLIAWVNDGHGSFTSRLAGRAGENFAGNFRTMASLNDDDEPDLVLRADVEIPASLGLPIPIPRFEPGPLLMMPGLGQGEFGPPIEISAAGDFQGGSFFDLDKDGRDDLVYHDIELQVRRARPDGTLGPVEWLGVTDAAGPFVIHDLGADGSDDYLMPAVGGLRITNPAEMAASGLGPTPYLPSAYESVLADVDGDGLPDLVGQGYVRVEDEYGQPALWYSRNLGSRRFGEAVVQPFELDIRPLLTADFDGDGRTDILATTYPSRHVFWSHAPEPFEMGEALPIGDDDELAAADLDGDGAAELLVTDQSSLTVYQVSREAFTNRRTIELDVTPLRPLARDLDGDGRLDLYVLTYAYMGNLRQFINQGDFEFEELPAEDVPANSRQAVLLNWLGDAQPEMLDPYYDDATVYGREETGEWITRAHLGRLEDFAILEDPDIDGDGRADILTTPFTSNRPYELLLSDPGRGTGDAIPVSVPTGADNVMVADVDADGRRDLVVLTGGGRLVVRRGLALPSTAVDSWHLEPVDWTVRANWVMPEVAGGEVTLWRQKIPAFVPEVAVATQIAVPGPMSLVDPAVPAPGHYRYWLVYSDSDGDARTLVVGDVNVQPSPGPARLLGVDSPPGSGPFRIAYEARAAMEGELDIVGVNGRLIRRLPVNLVPTSRGTLTWDGASTRGAPVASGVYFARLTGIAGTTRVIVIR